MLNYNKIYLILATILAVNLYAGFLPWVLQIILGGGLLFLAAWCWGKKLSDGRAAERLSLGFFHILATAAIVGSIFFYLFSLGKLAIIACLAVIFLKTKNSKIKFSIFNFQFSIFNLITIFYFLLSTFLMYLLAHYASDASIASPWLLLSKYFLPLFFVLAVLTIILSKKTAAHLPIFYFLFFSVAAFIYKIGYGFDIFNHEAAIKYILENGTITPKPFQYIGLYSIEIFLHRVSGLPLSGMAKFLLPATAAALPGLAIHFFRRLNHNHCHRHNSHSYGYCGILSLLLLPLSYFTVTTPQGMGNLFLIAIIFLSLAGHKIFPYALAALFIHPIAGITAFIYLALKKFKNKTAALAAGSFALPLIFMFLSYKFSGRVMLNFHFKETIEQFFVLISMGGFRKNWNLWLDLIYLLRIFFLPAIILAAVAAAWKYKKELSLTPLYAFLASQLGFFLMGVFTDFSYLINYEQKNYPERLFYISFLFLAPYLILAADKFCKYLSPTSHPPLITKREENSAGFSPLGNPRGELEGGFIFKFFFFLLFALAITANFYLNYPRWDNYENDKGKNVTSAMISAIKLVESNAAGKTYVVLSDQTVSAAALKTFGFKKYYKTPLGELFYYPIPTGGPLYNEFLNLVYNNAGARSAQNAKILTGAETAYVILPSYWENYEKIKENLKTKMRVIFEDKNLIILKL